MSEGEGGGGGLLGVCLWVDVGVGVCVCVYFLNVAHLIESVSCRLSKFGFLFSPYTIVTEPPRPSIQQRTLRVTLDLTGDFTCSISRECFHRRPLSLASIVGTYIRLEEREEERKREKERERKRERERERERR